MNSDFNPKQVPMSHSWKNKFTETKLRIQHVINHIRNKIIADSAEVEHIHIVDGNNCFYLEKEFKLKWENDCENVDSLQQAMKKRKSLFVIFMTHESYRISGKYINFDAFKEHKYLLFVLDIPSCNARIKAKMVHDFCINSKYGWNGDKYEKLCQYERIRPSSVSRDYIHLFCEYDDYIMSIVRDDLMDEFGRRIRVFPIISHDKTVDKVVNGEYKIIKQKLKDFQFEIDQYVTMSYTCYEPL